MNYKKCKNKKCDKFFEKRIVDPRDKNKFCSSKCALAVVRTKKHQSEAGKIGAALMIKKTRGTGIKGYIKEYGKHQHRVVMERIIGRKLKKGEIVHHIDRNKKNNDPSNLILCKNQSEHIKIHLKEDNGTLK